MSTEVTTHCGYVGIVGRPNVGKSTLLNRLIGQKLAITTRRPQTTRHNLLGIRTIGTGQIIYVDTPGIHGGGKKALNRYLNRSARAVVDGVDLLLFVVGALDWEKDDDLVLASVVESGVPVLLVVNKIDAVSDRTKLLPFIKECSEKAGIVDVVPVSAARGEQLEALEKMIVDYLPPGPFVFEPDQVTDKPLKFFAAELVREQMMLRYNKEIPYAVTVEIEKYEEKPGLTSIYAVVWVERPGQKAIIIGKNGAALKATATAARKSLEDFLETKVFLKVWVKVATSWASDENLINRLGYIE